MVAPLPVTFGGPLPRLSLSCHFPLSLFLSSSLRASSSFALSRPRGRLSPRRRERERPGRNDIFGNRRGVSAGRGREAFKRDITSARNAHFWSISPAVNLSRRSNRPHRRLRTRPDASPLSFSHFLSWRPLSSRRISSFNCPPTPTGRRRNIYCT